MPDPFLPLNPLGTCSSGENRRFQVKMAPCVDPPVSWSVAPRSQNPVVAGRIRGSCTPLGIMTMDSGARTGLPVLVTPTRRRHRVTQPFSRLLGGIWGDAAFPTRTGPPRGEKRD